MSQTLELPDAIYTALQRAAEANGVTLVAWIAARLPQPSAPAQLVGSESSPGILAERFAGRTGLIGSGGRERLSENTGETFADYLEARRRAGHL